MVRRLDENKVVTFGGEVTPKDGWCVILAGGPGSGKSTALKNKIMIQGKRYNPDDLSNFFDKYRVKNDIVVKNSKNKNIDPADYGVSKPYTMKNPEYVEFLHKISADTGLKGKKWDSMFSGGDILPNMIFDITGSNYRKINNIVTKAKEMGYKVSLVYVFADIDVQIERNSKRDRTVPEDIVWEITQEVYDTIDEIVNDNGFMSNNIDECWAITPIDVDMRTPKGMYDFISAVNVFSLKMSNGSISISQKEISDFINSQLDKISRKYDFKESYLTYRRLKNN